MLLCTIRPKWNDVAMSVIDDAKRSMRKAVRDETAKIGVEARRAAGLRVVAQVVAMKSFQAAETVFLFLALQREIDVDPLVEEALDLGKSVVVPRITVGGARMEAVRFYDFEDVMPGTMGIREPIGFEVVSPHAIDWILVPGVAFDAGGGRLGQGGGYYDAFLQGLGHRPRAVGVGYESQLVDAVPVEAHDQKIDGLVTETRLRIFDGFSETPEG